MTGYTDLRKGAARRAPRSQIQADPAFRRYGWDDERQCLVYRAGGKPVGTDKIRRAK